MYIEMHSSTTDSDSLKYQMEQYIKENNYNIFWYCEIIKWKNNTQREVFVPIDELMQSSEISL